jgi:hypothetical protein
MSAAVIWIDPEIISDFRVDCDSPLLKRRPPPHAAIAPAGLR